MQTISARDICENLDFEGLVPAISHAYMNPPTAPQRVHHQISLPASPSARSDATLLYMPAWRADDLIGIKLVTIFPDNAHRNEPSVYGNYLLLDGASGRPLAMMDGTALTLRRTAAVSALASSRLARKDARTLLMIGTGALAPHLIEAHARFHDLERILIWGRRPEKATALANTLSPKMPCPVDAIADLDAAQGTADIISAATLTTEPLIRSDLVRPGTHIDLVGAYRPDMAEADSALMAKGRIFVDTRAGALAEAGEILQAIQSGHISEDDIIAELSQPESLWQRGSTDEITIFKSVGSAISDFAAAGYLWQKRSSRQQ